MLGALDRERDELAAEADAKAEEVQTLQRTAETALQTVADLEAQLTEAREQASTQGTLLSAADAERGALRARLEHSGAAEEQLRAEAASQEDELAATADDLRKMIRENQILNEEL